jgi:hypothetical protein
MAFHLLLRPTVVPENRQGAHPASCQAGTEASVLAGLCIKSRIEPMLFLSLRVKPSLDPQQTRKLYSHVFLQRQDGLPIGYLTVGFVATLWQE